MGKTLEEISTQHTKKLEELKKFQEESANQLRDIIQDFMKTVPEIERFSWHQYTPYFNDGDVCEFGVHLDSTYINIIISGVEYEEGSRDLPGKDEKGYNKYINWDKEHPELANRFKEFTNQLSDMKDVLKAAFGDHAEVVVTQNGIEVEEYEHD